MVNKTDFEWPKDIKSITSYITSNFPELSVYIEEIPKTSIDSSNSEEDPSNEQEYYNSLEMLMTNFAIAHVVL